jgi:hypothetical protein
MSLTGQDYSQFTEDDFHQYIRKSNQPISYEFLSETLKTFENQNLQKGVKVCKLWIASLEDV